MKIKFVPKKDKNEMSFTKHKNKIYEKNFSGQKH